MARSSQARLRQLLEQVFTDGDFAAQYYQLLCRTHGLAQCDLRHLTEQLLEEAGMGKVFHRRRLLTYLRSQASQRVW